MIRKIKSVNLFAKDRQQALDFFVDKLDFDHLEDIAMDDGFFWLTVAPPGSDTVIVVSPPPPGALAETAEAPPESAETPAEAPEALVQSPEAPVKIVFTTDDVKAAFATLSERGVKFTTEPQDQGWGGLMAVFTDSQGNGFALVEEES